MTGFEGHGEALHFSQALQIHHPWRQTLWVPFPYLLGPPG